MRSAYAMALARRPSRVTRVRAMVGECLQSICRTQNIDMLVGYRLPQFRTAAVHHTPHLFPLTENANSLPLPNANLFFMH